jgi:predicted enzyme related to lactoylglutathione lyase
MLRGMTTVAYQADDMEAAKRWYADLLGVEPYLDREGYAEFRFGDYQHELGLIDRRYLSSMSDDGELSTASPDGSGAVPRPVPSGAILYWHVDDVTATLDRLQALGATIFQPPRDFGEGFVGAAVVDPFGNILGVMHNPHYLDVLDAAVASKATAP